MKSRQYSQLVAQCTNTNMKINHEEHIMNAKTC